MANDKCLLGVSLHQTQPEFYTLFQKYGAVFSPCAYRETSPEGKQLLGELLGRDLALIVRLPVLQATLTHATHQQELLESHCTTKPAIILINTLACVAVELSRDGFLDIDPWEAVIKRFGDTTELYIGRVCRIKPPRTAQLTHPIAPYDDSWLQLATNVLMTSGHRRPLTMTIYIYIK